MGIFMWKQSVNWLRHHWSGVVMLAVLLGSFVSAPVQGAAATRVDARAAVMIDQQTGQVLYAQNATKRYPVASVTKILTLLVIEDDIAHHRLDWEQKIKIDHAVAKLANDWRFSNVQLNEGESYTVKSLVESMMIVSADGSAEALALASAGSTQAFNQKMQKMAHRAGVTDAKIYNMIGLSNGELGRYGLKGVDKDAENLFSAQDMAKIAAYLLNHYPDVTKLTSQKFVNFRVTDGQEEQMININAMLPENGVAAKGGEIDGLKTGLTDKAGNCFVGSGTFANRRIITVVLHAPGEFNNQFTQTQKMLDIVMNRATPVTLTKVQQLSAQVQTVKVAHGHHRHQTGVKINSTVVWVPKQLATAKHWPAKLKVRSDQDTIAHRQVRAPVKAGQRVGTITLQLAGMPDFTLPAWATTSVAKHHWWQF